MATLATLIAATGIDVDPHLSRELTIPITNTPQRQGDIILIPATAPEVALPNVGNVHVITGSGFPVVRGENGGNTHAVVAGPGVKEGDVTYAEALPSGWGDDINLDLGVLTVAKEATAYLAHPEHGYAGIAPGCYVIRRQREQADVIRMVQD